MQKYLELVEQTELTASDCETIAGMFQAKRRLDEALAWTERGLHLERRSSCFGAAGPKLGEMKRVLLAKLGRRGEALDSAWSEYQAHPGRSTYEERMRWTPPPSARSGTPRRLLCPRRGTSLRYKFWNTLPLELTAALATWVKTRRIIRLPLGLRLFLETSADSSRPGHTPTQDATCCGDGNEAAAGPTSAMIW